MADGNFGPLQNRHPLTDRQKLSQVITSASPTAVPNLVHIRPRGVSGQMGEKQSILLFIYAPFRELTYRSDALTDFRA